MAYFDAQGRECTYSEAFSNGRLRPGFRSTVGDGETVGFDYAFMDSRGSMFVTDSTPPPSEDHSRRQLLAMTGRDAIGTPPRVQAVIDRIASEAAGERLVRDAFVEAAVQTYGRRSAALTHDAKLAGARDVRDAALAARYR